MFCSYCGKPLAENVVTGELQSVTSDGMTPVCDVSPYGMHATDRGEYLIPTAILRQVLPGVDSPDIRAIIAEEIERRAQENA